MPASLPRLVAAAAGALLPLPAPAGVAGRGPIGAATREVSFSARRTG